jgi:hypothetical protein
MMREIVHFVKHAKIMGIREDPAGCVRRTRRASSMKVRQLTISTELYHDRNIIVYVIIFSEPADQH